MMTKSSSAKSSSANVNTQSTEARVSTILDRRNEARRWMQINYWDEWEEVYRSSKCLTKKIFVTARDGSQVEDTTRTNVRMPETSLIIRRKTARLTANPPEIRYASANGNDDIAEKLTALNYQQFDRSGEIQQHRRMVQSACAFGFGVTKLYWDTIDVNRKFLRATISQSDDPMEQAQLIAKYGATMQIEQRIKKYEGPCVKNIFIGDFFLEPGCLTVSDSAWCVENYWETELWLKKMVKKTYLDPETGEEKPVFDPKAARELMDMGTWNPNFGTQQPYDLRTRFRTNVLGQQVPLFPVGLIPGKRFDILEHHCRDENGVMWISWVGNEKVFLGMMPYPWDLYGKYTYTEFVPMFDPLSVYGDSTPRLLRFLQSLHDATVGARKDLVSNLLRPVILKKWGEDVPDEQVDRKLFKEVVVKDLNSYRLLIENPSGVASAISAASEEEAQIMRMMAIAEPNLTNTEAGTASNPQAGKTATTAVLAAKSADALTQFELDSLNWYLKEQSEKKLWMMQQQQVDEDFQITPKFYSRVEGLTERYGRTAEVTLSQLDIQEEFEVEPVAMSMLSVDDDLRRQAAQQLVQMSAQMPGIVDPHYAARFYAGTIRGIDPDKAVPPPPPVPPSPPPPKFAVNIAVKWPELPAEIQAQILQGAGGQITPAILEELQHAGTLEAVKKTGEAADAAGNIMSPAEG
jgi:hypothetical protein